MSSLVINNLPRLSSSIENLCDIFKVLRMLDISLRCLEENIFINRFSDDSENFNYLTDTAITKECIFIEDDSDEEISEKKRIFKGISNRFLLKKVIQFLVIGGVLGGLYYWLLTRYDKDEMSGLEYKTTYYDLHEKRKAHELNIKKMQDELNNKMNGVRK